ncbi:Uncharacterized damage-inducible protein DinB (forms a four-helix bundle) [Chitinophaga sp. YR573]|uniref:DinB family protein n=1 Tax=Chitinophaga sp. YR573 TaxID=1881040 RepID=UPI0008D1477A|nr:DinB family protein [Chitinophaga sp. YR573]SEW34936.1 Uncharacterized damage-inducible protein DinB (forms a four-helix bundle) [Chitinophaga sp. YR573]
MTNNTLSATETVITPQAMLAHWQGHRRLTRRTIEAFPEDKLFSYSVGGMRTFSELITEITDIAANGILGIVTGKWKRVEELDHYTPTAAPTTKAAILEYWDEITADINTLWPQIPAERFQEVDKAFGMYEGIISDLLLYFIDNEIHHRAQGYVYLRTLGIEPPAFWNRD